MNLYSILLIILIIICCFLFVYEIINSCCNKKRQYLNYVGGADISPEKLAQLEALWRKYFNAEEIYKIRPNYFNKIDDNERERIFIKFIKKASSNDDILEDWLINRSNYEEEKQILINCGASSELFGNIDLILQKIDEIDLLKSEFYGHQYLADVLKFAAKIKLRPDAANPFDSLSILDEDIIIKMPGYLIKDENRKKITNILLRKKYFPGIYNNIESKLKKYNKGSEIINEKLSILETIAKNILNTYTEIFRLHTLINFTREIELPGKPRQLPLSTRASYYKDPSMYNASRESQISLTDPLHYTKPDITVHANNHQWGNSLDPQAEIGLPGEPIQLPLDTRASYYKDPSMYNGGKY